MTGRAARFCLSLVNMGSAMFGCTCYFPDTACMFIDVFVIPVACNVYLGMQTLEKSLRDRVLNRSELQCVLPV